MGLKDQAVTWRRYFHQFPELSDKEFKTTQKIKDILTEHHIRILETYHLRLGLLLKWDKV